MPTGATLLAFAIMSFGLVLTPGPNMFYLVSRSLSQGAMAGAVSLAGVGTVFLLYMVASCFGLTAFVMALPFVYDVLRIAGALFLAWIAWQIVRPGGASPFTPIDCPPESRARLFAMGFLTSALNPKVALFYMALLPQFIVVERGDVLSQSLTLGALQIMISMAVNLTVILSAARIARLLRARPRWQQIQRYVTGTVLIGFATRMLIQGR